MSARRLAAFAAVSLLAAPAAAQVVPPRGGETPRHEAAAAAATRALNLCSGLWSGGLSREVIERDLNGRDPGGALAAGLSTSIDEAGRTVSVAYDAAMPPRIVVWRPVLGCVQLPPGAAMAAARTLPRLPANIRAPDLDAQPWPLGDKDAQGPLPADRRAALDKVVAAAFDPAAYGGVTWAVLIVADGKIVAERYAPGYGPHIGSQTHSAAKSFAASLAGLAIRDKLVDLRRPGLLAAWRRPGDPRGAITLEHLLRMSSGLYTEGRGSPLSTIYAQGGAVADHASANILDSRPGTRFVYAPPDTQLVMRAIREAMRDDARYLAWPYRELFWKIGMTRTTANGDWNGDFYLSGQTWSTARDFARFGLLYLNDGLWMGKRLLPEGWATYVATRGPAQPPRAPFYGAQFWLHGGMAGLPEDAFTPAGGQGHYAMIIRSRNVVVVRRGVDGNPGFRIDPFSADVLKALGR